MKRTLAVISAIACMIVLTACNPVVRHDELQHMEALQHHEIHMLERIEHGR